MAILIEPTFQAGRVSIRPLEFGNFGHYRANLISGATISLTAGDPIVSFRWTSTTSNAVLLRASVGANITSNITTAVSFDCELIKATAFTGSDSAGTVTTPTKLRASMPTSAVGDLRVSTTAKLTAGTRTLDSVGFAFGNILTFPTVTNVGSASVPFDLYWLEPGQYPITFAANEGFIARVSTAQNTSGGVRYTMTLDWAEVPVSINF